MEPIDDGGFAFPSPCEDLGNNIFQSAEYGMTLRDYFAAKAMQAIISKLPLVDQDGVLGNCVKDKKKYNADIANSAYWIADAMIAESSKTN